MTRKRACLSASVAALLSASAPLYAQSECDWYSVDAGGWMWSTGGDFELGGTIGQPDAGVFTAPLTGGDFELVGGFWVVASLTPGPCPGAHGDANCDGTVDFFDIDPFLMALFNPPLYAATYCSGDVCAADANDDGTVDFFDIDPFLNCLFSGCP
jgi:hypothetical protein